MKILDLKSEDGSLRFIFLGDLSYGLEIYVAYLFNWFLQNQFSKDFLKAALLLQIPQATGENFFFLAHFLGFFWPEEQERDLGLTILDPV